jgi:polyisoprenoid-binding protein YceI
MRFAPLVRTLAVTLICAPAIAAAPAAAGAHYTLDAAKSSLDFTFLQAGAKNTGHFPRFTVTLDPGASDPAGGKLEVTVDVAALDTGDTDRDEVLRGDDLFAVKKYPQATFKSTAITRAAGGYDAVGALTIRGVTRETHVPFTFREASEGGATVGYMAGKTVVRRLDFGVGQGDWKATDQAGNEVTVSFNLRLTRAGH